MNKVANVEGLHQRKTGKNTRTWYYRLSVPTADQEQAGCKDIWESLRTRDQKAAIAKLPAAMKRAKAKLVEKLRKGPQTPTQAKTIHPSSASTYDVECFAEEARDAHYVTVKNRDIVARAELFEKARADELAFFSSKIVVLPKTPYMERILEDTEFELDEALSYYWWHRHGERIAKLKRSLTAGDFSEAFTPLDTLLSGLGTSVGDKSERIILARGLLQAEIEALSDINAGDDKRYHALTSDTGNGRAVPVVPHDDKLNPLFSIAVEEWISEKSQGSWSTRRTASCKATVRLFLEIIGDRPIAAYKKADARDFKAVLRDLPPNRSKLKVTRDLSVRDAAKEARKMNLKAMSLANVNKLITIVSGCFDWLFSNYDTVVFNPFNKMTISTKSNIRDEKHPFKLEDLKSIFNAPVFKGCKSEIQWKHAGAVTLQERAKYWLPLLALYTGARLNELCKLRSVDVQHADGVDFIDINIDEHSDAKIGSSVKTPASNRQIPIHPDLVDFGFLDYVSTRRKAGGERLFPELKPDGYGSLSDKFGKYFHRFLDSIGVKRDKIDFHSFRHSWTDACRNSRISVDVIYALKGEALKGTLSRYGDGKTDLEILEEEMKKLKFKGLDLSHLKTSQPRKVAKRKTIKA